MSLYSKVIWKEGTFLEPQHLQQMERSLESSIHFSSHLAGPFSWGVMSLELDDVAISEGTVELRRCRALFQDGTQIDIPGVDPAPPSRAFSPPAQADHVTVYLALPRYRQGAMQVTADPTRNDARYRETMLEVADENAPARVETLDVGIKNLRLVFSGEKLDGLSVLPIAQVQRMPDGMLALRREFVPPALWVGASSWLSRRLREIAGTVAARARSISEEMLRRGLSGGGGEPAFQFLQTLSYFAPVLQQFAQIPAIHPFRAYEELLRLTGSLSAFALRPDSPTLPFYQHDDLEACFTELEKRLRGLLNQLVRSQFEVYPFIPGESWPVCQIAGEDLVEGCIFFLAVRGKMPASELLAKVPSAVKLASPADLGRLVRTHTAGLKLEAKSRPPAPIPVKPDAYYFSIDTGGPEWAEVRARGELAAYIPSWLPGLELELIGVRPAAST